jgi:hypothetical protein
VCTGLFTIALLISAPGPIGLQIGDEFTFAGTVVEKDTRPGQQLHREYELTLRVFVLERQENWADAAVLTRLRRTEDAVGGVSKPVTGTGPDKNAPPIVKLDIVRIHTDGTLHLLMPVGPTFRLASDTPAQAVPPIRLDAFSPFEFGVFPPRIPRSAEPGEPWTVAAGPGLPDELWAASKREFIHAEQCQKLLMNQQSADWDRPVGGQTSWHRADAVWVSTQDGTARMVHRVIRQRDGLPKKPIEEFAAWVETKYELKEHEKLNGRTFDRARRDVVVAYTALSDASILIRSAAKFEPRILESKLTKLDAYLEETEPGTPYREAVIAARRTLDAARRGDVVPPPSSTTPTALARVQWPQPGQLAPNLRAGNIQLSEQRGKPAVLVFFRPGSETADLSLAIADALQKRYTGKISVFPLTVSGDVEAGIKDRNRLKLTIPVHDGAAAAAAYGIETVPRFAVIDSDGKIKWTFSGVGSETGFLVAEQVKSLVHPALPNGPGGIIPAPGSTTTLPVVRP